MKLVKFPVTTSISAGTAIDISSVVKGNVRTLNSAWLFIGSDGTAPAAHSALTVVTATPAAGEIQLSGKKEVKCGDALDSMAELTLMVEYELENLRL